MAESILSFCYGNRSFRIARHPGSELKMKLLEKDNKEKKQILPLCLEQLKAHNKISEAETKILAAPASTASRRTIILG